MDSSDGHGPTRREALGGAAASLAMAPPSLSRLRRRYTRPMPTSALSRQPSAKRAANGINIYRIDTNTGAWSHVQHVGDLVRSAWQASNLRRAILLPSDSLLSVVWCTQGR
jgi:hypothetical protein